MSTGQSCSSESTSTAGAVQTCTGGSDAWPQAIALALAVVAALGPIFTTGWLIRTARRYPTAGDPAHVPAAAV